jgi:SNF family Na+-dependent transporter
MNSYRVSFYFDTIEEAESEEQAIEQAEEFFETSLGAGGIKHRASHFSCRADIVTNKSTYTVMDKIISNLKAQK